MSELGPPMPCICFSALLSLCIINLPLSNLVVQVSIGQVKNPNCHTVKHLQQPVQFIYLLIRAAIGSVAQLVKITTQRNHKCYLTQLVILCLFLVIILNVQGHAFNILHKSYIINYFHHVESIYCERHLLWDKTSVRASRI